LTPAQAATLWHPLSANSSRAAHTLATSASDPAYQAPAKHGVDYVAPSASGKGLANGAEKLNLRTANSRTFTGNGRQLVTNVYPESVNYRDASGAWQSIDNSLVRTSQPPYAYQNRANRFGMYLPSDIGAAPVRVTHGSEWMTFTIAGAKAQGTISGSTVTYSNALPGVTVVISAQSDGVEEGIVLQGPSAQTSFTYQLQTSPGLKLEPVTGGLSILDLSGKELFRFAAPAMFDSSNSARGRSSSLAVTATGSGRNATLTVKPDATWLHGQGRRWPVTIDPTLIVTDAQDCYLNAASPTTTFCGVTSLNAGFDGTNASRALLQFGLQAVPTTDAVLSARLFLFLGSASTSSSTSLSVYQLTHAWTSGATWNTYDGTNAWTTSGGDFSSTAAATANGIAASGQWYTWSPTALVQGWVNGSIANDGLILKEPTESTTNLLSFKRQPSQFARFNRPWLRLDQPMGLHDGPGCDWSGRYTGAPRDPSSVLRYVFSRSGRNRSERSPEQHRCISAVFIHESPGVGEG
jgi:hypothetical protein